MSLHTYKETNMKFITILLLNLCLVFTANATDYVQQYVVGDKVVEYDNRYFSGLDGFFSTQNLVSQQQTEERLSKVEEQLKTLIEILQNINSKLGDGNDSVDVEPSNPNSDGDNNDSDTPDNDDTTTPTTPLNPGGEPSELDIAAYNIFSTKCTTCHGKTENNDGGLHLVDKGTESLFYQNLATRVNIFDRVNGVGLEERGLSRMPKGGQLLDEEVETLRLWMVEEANK